WVRLREREELAERRGELVLRAGQLAEHRRVGRRAPVRLLGVDGRRPGGHDPVQGLALVAQVALGGLDQVGHQVVAAGQLYVDLRVRLLVGCAAPDEPGVRNEDITDYGDDDDHSRTEEQTDLPAHAGSPSRRT